jgi:hypothetical protein
LLNPLSSIHSQGVCPVNLAKSSHQVGNTLFSEFINLILIPLKKSLELLQFTILLLADDNQFHIQSNCPHTA